MVSFTRNLGQISDGINKAKVVKEKLREEYSCSNFSDSLYGKFEHMVVADMIKASTLRYGFGHTDSYYSVEVRRGAEILANTGQMYINFVRAGKWNPHFEKHFGFLIPEIKKYWNEVFGKNI